MKQLKQKCVYSNHKEKKYFIWASLEENNFYQTYFD
ncbi:unnamed protein product [Paramecium sonneborni]|uniref:Uncharacterized protein n=1 Tax=Paramecium sonneborni TaxID=65129 RepID=A0A8S1NWZ1_9CILI|nr:unnamed protein product [Paramecium sonneborni]